MRGRRVRTSEIRHDALGEPPGPEPKMITEGKAQNG